MNKKLIREWIKKNDPQGTTKLAARAEVCVSTVLNIINKGHMPSLDTAKRIAAAMGVTLNDVGNSGTDTPPAA
jgi:hypothetical protein